MGLLTDLAKLESDVAAILPEAEQIVADIKAIVADISSGTLSAEKSAEEASAAKLAGTRLQNLACFAVAGYNAALPLIEALTGETLPPMPVPAFCTTPSA